MAVLIKGMEVPGPPLPGVMHPAMKLLEAAWPALTAVAEAPVCQQDADVVDALCEVYKVCESGGKERGSFAHRLGTRVQGVASTPWLPDTLSHVRLLVLSCVCVCATAAPCASCLQRSVQTARSGAKPLLVTLLKAVGDLFVATQQASCLDMLATITEVFGEVKSAPELAVAQQQALEGGFVGWCGLGSNHQSGSGEAAAQQACGALLKSAPAVGHTQHTNFLPLLPFVICVLLWGHPGAVAAVSSVLVSRTSAGQPLSASGDLLQSLLSVADAHLVFARDLMLSSSTVPAVFEWAVAAAGLREREPANAAFSFLSHLLAAANKVFAAAAEAAAAQQPAGVVEQQAAVLQQCIAQQGQKLMRTLVLAACDTAPRQLMRALAGVLYQLLQASLTGEAGKQWLLAVLQAQDLPGGCCCCLRDVLVVVKRRPLGDWREVQAA